MRRWLAAVPIAVLVVGGSTACATKKFVRTSVGEVNDKVDALGKSLEETQERTRRNETRIAEVDTKADNAAQAAQQARGAADQAQSAAGVAQQSANAAGARVDVVDKTIKKMVFEVVLSEDEGNFKFAKAELPDEAKAKLDQMISQIKADPKGAFFEIEGHTDDVGDPLFNEKLGMERAEAVKRYLYEHHQIPLFKMNVISYGEEKPIAPNKTKEGRAQNRRVVIKVLV